MTRCKSVNFSGFTVGEHILDDTSKLRVTTWEIDYVEAEPELLTVVETQPGRRWCGTVLLFRDSRLEGKSVSVSCRTKDDRDKQIYMACWERGLEHVA